MAKGSKLIDQRQALDSFFESLMRDVEAYAETEAVEPEPVAASPAPEQRDAAPAPVSKPAKPAGEVARLPVNAPPAKPVLVKQADPALYAPLPPVAPAPSPPQPTVTPEVVQEQPAAVAAQPAAPVTDPAWMGQELQAMLFKVAGLTLAVPLVDLHGVVEWDDGKVTEMPGHADFYLGLLSHLKRNIPIIDTARLVLPPDKLVTLGGEDPRQRITRIVLISDSRYGLACDEVNEVITLRADDVRWRSERTRRRWLAGTVIKHMCALIDATAFAELLADRAPVEAFRE